MQDDLMSMARDGIRQRADRMTRLDFSRQGFIRKPNQHRIIHSPLHILCTFTSAHRIRTMGWKDTDSRQKPLLDCRMPRARRSYATCKTIVCHVHDVRTPRAVRQAACDVNAINRHRRRMKTHIRKRAIHGIERLQRTLMRMMTADSVK